MLKALGTLFLIGSMAMGWTPAANANSCKIVFSNPFRALFGKEAPPPTPAKYQTTPMLEHHIGEDAAKGVYRVRTQEELDHYKLEFDPKTQHWKFARGLELMDGHYLYHMDENGNLYGLRVNPDFGAVIQHSSLPNGKPSAGVGTTMFESGKMRAIDRCSGHYHPPVEIFRQVINELGEKGVDMTHMFLGFTC